MPTCARSMDEIEQQLAESIYWNRARVKFLARFLVARRVLMPLAGRFWAEDFQQALRFLSCT
jgi:hypothetical protein